VYDNNETVACN